ncbi:MAG: NADP-dependent oxidoreductase [Myxococcota bacterium]
MRAWVLKRGKKEPVLEEREVGAPGRGQVHVRTSAVGLHPVDVETSQGGNAMLLAAERPFVPGVDFAGVVERTGPDVDDVEAGQIVFGYRGVPQQGAFAEEALVPRSHLAVVPGPMGVEALATLPLPGLCALQALEDAGLDTPGRVLVHGGAGGVGSVAVQVMAARGHEVVATASAKDVEWTRELGASQVVDYRTTRFEDVVSEVDLVLDTIGGDTLARSFGVVKPTGAVASLSVPPDAATLRRRGFTVPFFMGPILGLMGMGHRRRARRAGAPR